MLRLQFKVWPAFGGINFVLFFRILHQNHGAEKRKIVKKAFFNQGTHWAAPICWSKYTKFCIRKTESEFVCLCLKERVQPIVLIPKSMPSFSIWFETKFDSYIVALNHKMGRRWRENVLKIVHKSVLKRVSHSSFSKAYLPSFARFLLSSLYIDRVRLKTSQ